MWKNYKRIKYINVFVYNLYMLDWFLLFEISWLVIIVIVMRIFILLGVCIKERGLYEKI